MKKINFTQKLVLILMLTILVNMLMVSNINADYNPTATTGEGSSSIPKFDSPIGNPDGYSPEYQKMTVTSKIVGTIIKWIRNMGVIVGVLVLTIIGIKYMLAGAAEEKAQYKETLVPVVIGVVMLLGSITLISAIATLME